LGEYLRRVDSGDVVDARQFAAGYPEISTELASCLETAAMVEQMAGRSAGSAEARDTSISLETLAAGPEAFDKAPTDSVRKTMEAVAAAPLDLPRTFSDKGRWERSTWRSTRGCSVRWR
jgi:hypothetical protein